ncbi:putative transmembrane protein [Cavenderia fasciculata]|uniref:Transmembrane protein n=1 Tax=Cavenderia fasciculata TaxID=261658 RepID=F4PM56_CACFS|nr:putative transmembrane protein [Cavenderia fasciculata]EGG23556.1 putative transmembrane protein [Cavenderia fasciculata]|eukprot:XP_004361407.1 putative transmembrane protein [Cavenderia fasciculata]
MEEDNNIDSNPITPAGTGARSTPTTPRGQISSPSDIGSPNPFSGDEDDNTSVSSSESETLGVVIPTKSKQDLSLKIDEIRRSKDNFPLAEGEKSVRLRPRSSSVNGGQQEKEKDTNNNNNNNNNNTSNQNIEEIITVSGGSRTPRNPMVDLTSTIKKSDSDSSIEVDEDDEDEEDYDENDDDADNDTIKNEKGHTEMHELSEDKIKGQKERDEAKKINNRRLQLHWATHLAEVSLEYGKVTIVALVACIIMIILAYGFSTQSWIKRGNGTTDYFYKNSVTVLTSTFFIIGLAIFTGIQFWAVFGMKRMLQTKFYLWVVAAIGLFLVVPWGMNAGDQSYWYWLGDVLLLIIGYTGLCFVMGYVGKSYQTNPERIKNGFAFLGTELLVSACALAYGMFLIQLYSNFSNVSKIAWRLLVHPIYFEIFMMIPVRLLVTKQMERKGVNIMHSLAVVHAQAHISTLGRMMISTINQTEFTIVSVLLLNIGKLVFRSSVQLRDRLASNMISKITHHEHKESKKFVRAVGMYTEMIMENSSIPASAFTMWVFYDNRGLFFFPYPDGGTFTLGEAALNSFIQLIGAFVFDIITLWINERYFGLPLERAWKKMRENWAPFFGFLIYGIATMGMGGIIWMACKLPRFVTCSSHDVCSCKFVEDCQEFIDTRLS